MATSNPLTGRESLVSASSLMACRNALIDVYGENAAAALENKHCSFIRLSIYFEPGTTGMNTYENTTIYVLTTSGIKIEGNKKDEDEEAIDAYRYYVLEDLYENLSMLRDDLTTKELANRLDNTIVTSHELDFEIWKSGVISFLNKPKREIVVQKYAKESMRSHTKEINGQTVSRYDDFFKTVLNLTKDSKGQYDIEKWVSGSFEVTLKPEKKDKDEDKFSVVKYKLKIKTEDGSNKSEYCCDENAKFLRSVFKEVTGNCFGKKFNLPKRSENEKGKTTGNFPFLLFDILSECVYSLYIVNVNSDFISNFTKHGISEDELSKQKAAILMFLELRNIYCTINQVITSTKYEGNKFFTSDSESPIKLQSIDPLKCKGAPLVSVFKWLPKNPFLVYNYFFIFDPALSEHNVSFINGLKTAIDKKSTAGSTTGSTAVKNAKVDAKIYFVVGGLLIATILALVLYFTMISGSK